MTKGIFITGTDTGVGKTFVAEGLIKAVREKGLNVCPMKPLETGCRLRQGRLIPADTVRLIRASGVDEEIDLINPYRFMAAEIEGVKINRKRIFSAYDRISKKYDITIVEGAGGIMVPVFKKYLFIDLINDLELPLVIVSRPGLGTINHTLLTIDSLKNKGLHILGVIINYSVNIKKGLTEKTNPEVIEKLAGSPVLGIVPYLRNPSDGRIQKTFERIAAKILPGSGLIKKQRINV
jgi:dethiobiotin synthetase